MENSSMDFKNLRGKSLSELLKQYSEAIALEDDYTAAVIEVYLTNTFTPNTSVLVESAVLDAAQLPELTLQARQQIVDARKCAGKIIDEINPMSIFSYEDIKKKVDRLIDTHRSLGSVRSIQ
jgi:hypothetical protein